MDNQNIKRKSPQKRKRKRKPKLLQVSGISKKKVKFNDKLNVYHEYKKPSESESVDSNCSSASLRELGHFEESPGKNLVPSKPNSHSNDVLNELYEYKKPSVSEAVDGNCSSHSSSELGDFEESSNKNFVSDKDESFSKILSDCNSGDSESEDSYICMDSEKNACLDDSEKLTKPSEKDSTNDEGFEDICAENKADAKSETISSKLTEGCFEFETSVSKLKEGHSAIIESVFLNSTKTCIIVIGAPSTITFHGRFSVSVISGIVNILGYDLKSNGRFTDVYSPRGGSFLTFEIPKNDHFDIDKIQKGLKEFGVSKSFAQYLLQNAQSTTCILALKAAKNDYLKFCEKFISQKLLPTDYLKKSKNCTEVEKYLECRFLPNLQNSVTIDEDTEDIFTKLVNTNGSSFKTMFCGGKGVGKSTLTRYFVNKLLNIYSQVLYIDLDPGQSEFTIPGCISAVVVKNPLLGPNYSHPIVPEKCIFIKDIDVGTQPLQYLDCVNMLYKQCSTTYENIPTVINFMGFTRHLGLPLTAAAIINWQPSAIVQIESESSSVNYPTFLTKSVVEREASKFLRKNCVCSDYNLIVMNSLVTKNLEWKLQARLVRELLVLTYFSQMNSTIGVHSSLLGPGTSTYIINISSINLVSFRQYTPHILAVMNANLVGICSNIDNNIYNCHGWGIVRGIDKLGGKLYICTPVDLENLQFDALVLGSVNLPPSVYMSTEEVNGLVPYVSVGIPDSLGRVPKKKYFPAKE